MTAWAGLTVYTNTLSEEGTNLILLKQTTLILPNSFQNAGVLIDNIFVMFRGHDFYLTVGILMNTNRAPILAYLFLYSYEAYCIQRILEKTQKEVSPTL